MGNQLISTSIIWLANGRTGENSLACTQVFQRKNCIRFALYTESQPNYSLSNGAELKHLNHVTLIKALQNLVRCDGREAGRGRKHEGWFVLERCPLLIKVDCHR